MRSPTKNELEIITRVEAIEAIVFETDNIEMAKALSKGAVHGTVNLAAELADLIHEVNKIKLKLNEIIDYVKN